MQKKKHSASTEQPVTQSSYIKLNENRHFLSKEYVVSLYPWEPQTKNIVLVNVKCYM